MASLLKLSIQGVRSYSPEHPSVIEFFSPLTLIVGANGAGKTTIIEALKYVCTNDMPPGSKNSAFIHDPKVVGESEVKGVVKLSFLDVSGKKHTSTRAMVSTQKLKKLETKSLEVTLSRTDEDGKKVNAVPRCIDLNKEMISLLGVSKAVLDCVVFCHQEDSCWPLSEGKILKQKFDEIFDATKYIKALECIRSCRKELHDQVERDSTELKHLKCYKDQAEEKAKSLNSINVKISNINNHISELEKQKQPLEESLRELTSCYHQAVSVDRIIGEQRSAKAQLMQDMLDFASRITEEFNGDMTELKQLSASFDQELHRLQSAINKSEGNLHSIEGEIRQAEQCRTKDLVDQGKLRAFLENHKANLQQCSLLVRSAALEFSIPGYDRDISTVIELESFLMDLGEVLASTRIKAEVDIKKAATAVEEAELVLTGLVTETGILEQTISVKGDMVNDSHSKHSLLRQKLTGLESSSARLSSLDQTADKIECELSELRLSLQTSDHGSRINGLTAKKDKLDTELRELRQEQNRVQGFTATQTRLDVLVDKLAERREELDRLLRKHEASFRTVLGQIPDVLAIGVSLKEQLEARSSIHTRDLLSQKDRVMRLKGELVSIETEQRVLREDLSLKRARMREIESRMNQMYMSTTSLLQSIEEVKSDVEKQNNTLMELAAFEKIYRKYIEMLQLEQPDRCCPLCERKFSCREEVDSLVSKLRFKVSSVPSKKDANNSLLQTSQSKLDRLSMLLPDHQKLAEFESEIVSISGRLEAFERNADSLHLTIDMEEEHLEDLSKVEEVLRSVMSDAALIDQFQKEIATMEEDISREKERLLTLRATRSLHCINSEISAKQSSLDGLLRDIEQCRVEQDSLHQLINVRMNELNDVKQRKLSIMTQAAERFQLEQQASQLEGSIRGLESEVQECREKLEPVLVKLRSARTQRDTLLQQKLEVERLGRDRMDHVHMKLKQLSDRVDEARRFEEDGNKADLENLDQSILLWETKINQLTSSLKIEQAEVNQLRSKISRHKDRHGQLESKIELLRKELVCQSYDEKITSLSSDLKRLGTPTELSRKIESLQGQLQSFMSMLSECRGEKRELEPTATSLQNELQKQLYFKAEDNYRQKVIEHKTAELAILDLDIYYKAVDRAVMQYHSAKMSEINKFIREYWINTYQGNDIDTIEIRSEEEDGAGSAKARRTYNYKVVMLRNGTALDMRGRCSAGQKMLASIIIRLALSEAFCHNCSILTLDEPTTNLDEYNVESLANSLAGLVRIRRQQKNFQLVVITHDEEFVNALGRSDFLDYYYRVKKDDNGFSRIHRHTAVELCH